MDEQTANGESHAGIVLAHLDDGEEGLLDAVGQPGTLGSMGGPGLSLPRKRQRIEAEDIHELYTEGMWDKVCSACTACPTRSTLHGS